MHAEETKIYYALLIGIVTLSVLMVYFLIMIFRFHKQIKAVRLERFGEDIDALEKDRERIAFELHDDFASSLGTLRMEVARLISPGEKNYDKLPGIKREIDSMVERMKDMAHEMMPRELTRRGISKALELLVARIRASSGINIQYTNDIGELDRKKSLHIYRIVQEVLNNVVKHSNATLTSFDIWRSDGKIYFRISDNGKGFNVKGQAARGSGAGLYNISARTQLMQGDMYITSAANEGATYEFEIPDK
jgi:signal transduction histidine kinase